MPGVSVFENHVDDYEAWFEKNVFAYQSELRAIKQMLPEKGKGLEIGVGSGLFAAPLGIRFGIEPSRAMMEKARARGINAVMGVAESLPFQNGEFDFALMVTTVCFLDDIDLAFREALRVLKPDGAFIVGFVDKNSPIGKSYEQRKNESLFYKNATFYAVDDLLPHLRNAGFKQFSFCQTLFGPVADMKEPAQIKEGYGEGSFVVIKAARSTSSTSIPSRV
jgi:SAM-dependent methyltransferase